MPGSDSPPTPPPTPTPTPTRTPSSSPAATPSFEQAVDQIESIVAKIESGELGLEESMAAYERAVGLIKRCRNDLSKAEQRVIELSKAMSDSAQDSSRSSD
jgi:exodeoxyribonuclease VII small subunit